MKGTSEERYNLITYSYEVNDLLIKNLTAGKTQARQGLETEILRIRQRGKMIISD